MSDAFDTRSPISLTCQETMGRPEPHKAFIVSYLMRVTSWHMQCRTVASSLRKVLHFQRRKSQALCSHYLLKPGDLSLSALRLQESITNGYRKRELVEPVSRSFAGT